MERKRNALIALGLLAVLFVGLNLAADAALKRARLDLTDQNLYTLSGGTRSILGELDEPLQLSFFFSESAGRGRPAIQSYAKRVRELLEEYRLRSGGDIRLEILDPEPFSEAEERAQREGLTAVPLGTTPLYFGLVGANTTDGRELIRFFDPSDERFLEYQLTRMVYKLSNPARPTVGVLSALPIEGQQANPMFGMPEQPRWQLLRELQELVDVRTIDAAATELPDDLDVLLLIHPKGLAEPMLRAIDDFVIGGGPAVVCVDPLCEADIPPDAQQNPMSLLQADRSSSLPELFAAWGVEMAEGKVACDRRHAMRGRSPQTGAAVPYVQYLALPAERFDAADATTGALSRMQIVAAGSLSPADGATTTFEPLITTSDESALIDASRLNILSNPQEIAANFLASGDEQVLAARVTGPATAAYAAEPAEGEQPGERRTGDIRVMLLADADLLADRWWVEELRLGQLALGFQKLSDNADFVVNAIDQMAGSADLIAVRARGEYARPFTMVEDIRRNAEQEYLAEAQRLQDERREVERRLSELQQARPDAGEVIFTPEQQAELERFRARLAETNAELRQVNFSLRKDVEQLGLTLKIINTAAAPALVALAAIGLSGYRASKRRADRRALAGAG